MNSGQRLFALVSCLVVPACASAPAASGTGDPAASVGVAASPLVATLNAVNSRVFGTVLLTPSGTDRSRVVISIRGAPMNSELPWEIRAGQCGEGGPALGLEAVYRVISARSDGTGELSLTVPMSIPAGPVHSVNVLASRVDRDRVVSCGVFSPAVR